ncbi:MAG: cell wall-binding repeat-containing protein, partial [Herbiconiux sp.]|nr:cell wall-binding repeat-containing protein [Herbiconiux sp.]
DPGLDRIYLSYVDSHVEVFSGADLSRDGIVQLDADAIAVNADIKTHRLFVVSPGATVLTMYAVEPRGKPVVERIAGVDRYEGSAKVSAARFAPMTGTAYVASGEGFADALSASAAAGADGGPVLLVQKNVVPLSIIAELRRLKPQRIVIVGGPLTVSEDVEKELGRFSASVSRVTGTDRFDVSANLSRGVFKSGKAVAYVASGLVFPDALSGSAAAGKNGSPVLLVQPDAVPTSVELELKRLAPAQIVVLGGRNTVSDPVLTQLNRIAPTSRTSGADRFDGSAAISAANFPAENPLVFVASGAVFPDALSGSAAAIAAGSPVLLVSKDTMAASIDRELDRLLPSKIIVLGGTGTISDAVLTALRDH